MSGCRAVAPDLLESDSSCCCTHQVLCSRSLLTCKSAAEQAQVRVIAQTDNVAGVRIPKFEQHNMSGESKMNLTGLGKGGQQVQQCRKVRRDGSLPSCNPGIREANAAVLMTLQSTARH